MKLIMLPLGASAAALLSAAGLFLAVEHRDAPKAPDYRVTKVGGLEYESMLGRPLDPSNRIDKQILAGLPRRDRRLPHGQSLYGAFISVTNDSTRALPAANRIELRDERGHLYRPISLPVSNPYAYAPRLVHARTRIPAQDTPAAENLAATGRLVLFRIPTWRYRNGRFELVIHNPRNEAATQSLIVS